MGSFLQGKDLTLLMYGRAVTSAKTAIGPTGSIFLVTGGRIVLTSLTGITTTVSQSQANAIKLTATPTTGTANDMCATYDVNAAEVGSLFSLDGVLATALQGNVSKSGAVGGMTKYQVVGVGAITLTTAATNTGAISWTATYFPLDTGASLASA